MTRQMTYEEAMRFLVAGSRGASRLGLERMGRVLAAFGNPERQVRAIHVAGTNGKGSTSAYLASIFASAGLRCGLYCSPYVDRFGERIRILDGRRAADAWWLDPSTGEIPQTATTSILNRMRTAIETLQLDEEAHPTHFEMLTMMAFIYFAEQGCDLMILETGLGGRLDSTNIIPTPEAAVLTSIDLDHIHVLGDSLAEIASEKAGIIKPGTRCFVQDQRSGGHNDAQIAEIMQVINTRCAELDVPLTVLDHDSIERTDVNIHGQRFRLNGDPDSYHTALVPAYQSLNAALAVTVAQELLQERFGLTTEAAHDACHRGVSSAYVPARFEILSKQPVVIRDGGHNPQGALVLSETLQEVFPSRPIHMILAVMGDKDYSRMVEQFFAGDPHEVRTIYCVAPDAPRALEPDMLRAFLHDKLTQLHKQGMIERVPDIRSDLYIHDALAHALEAAESLAHTDEPELVLAWGSLYQAGETLAAWQELTQ